MKNHRQVLAWQDCRQRVRWFFPVGLGGFGVSLVLVALLSGTPFLQWAARVIVGLWMVGFIGAALRLQWFRCPRCNERFFPGTFGYWPFARACRRCGLPVWQD